jgi:phosphoribosylamine--glycine ligase
VKVLVVGNGGREHAIAWKLVQSPQIAQCYCVPGNGGTATLRKCENVSFNGEDFEDIAQFCLEQVIDLVVVGPEVPLALGIVDYLQSQQIRVFGPTQAGARIEASKSWAKALMIEAGVPTALGETFTDQVAAQAYLEKQGVPIVVKADGLAAGKGVIVAETLAEAQRAIAELFAAGFEQLVLEECLVGEEVSVLALSDGLTVRPLLPAQDHKRIGEGDTGSNTGGMGVYAPAPIAPTALIEQITREVLQPTIDTLRQRGIDYRGVLYAGLMISPTGGIKVLEFNCRFGDPETQAILPLLETPLEDVLMACTEQRLAQFPPLIWRSLGNATSEANTGSQCAVCVVMASQGYPGSYEKGKVITGLDQAEAQGAVVFQAGTCLQSGQLLTDGGRVLGVTALGDDFGTAIARAYEAVAQIEFEGHYYRRDIGQRALNR